MGSTFNRLIRMAAIAASFMMLAGCNPAGNNPAGNNPARDSASPAIPPIQTAARERSLPPSIQKAIETDRFTFYCYPQDEKVSADIQKTLEEKAPGLCNELGHPYSGKIRVEVYPDQKSYDESLGDPGVAGSPACSGNGTIKMVCPTSPIKAEGIPYGERLMMAVHEYVHLMVDQINDGAPVWLDEGLASYKGSQDGYDAICRYAFAQLPAIDFSRLEADYHNIPAADVYSCSAVRFIIENYGQDRFNRLLRKPEDFEKILQTTKKEFNVRWNEYIRKTFK